jgi:hypothetical protein
LTVGVGVGGSVGAGADDDRGPDDGKVDAGPVDCWGSEQAATAAPPTPRRAQRRTARRSRGILRRYGIQH